MIGRLLCFLGIHDWWLVASPDPPPNWSLLYRCRRCPMQMFETGRGRITYKNWEDRHD